jgi:small subunit ribosomal protein S14
MSAIQLLRKILVPPLPWFEKLARQLGAATVLRASFKPKQPFPFQVSSMSSSFDARFVALLKSAHSLQRNVHFAMTKIRILRDIKARNGVNANEIARRAYLFVARNQALPPQVRYQAQLQLNTFDKYTRPTTVKNRCIESGRGRGIISEFGLTRVSRLFCLTLL